MIVPDRILDPTDVADRPECFDVKAREWATDEIVNAIRSGWVSDRNRERVAEMVADLVGALELDALAEDLRFQAREDADEYTADMEDAS